MRACVRARARVCVCVCVCISCFPRTLRQIRVLRDSMRSCRALVVLTSLMWPKHVACVALSIKHDIYDDGRRHRQSTPLRSTMCVQVPSLVSHIPLPSQLPMSCAKVGGSYSATLEHRGSTSLCTSPLTVYSSLTTDCVQITHHLLYSSLTTDCVQFTYH